MSDSKRVRRHFMEDGGKGKGKSKGHVKKKRFVREERTEYNSQWDWKRDSRLLDKE